MLVLPAHSQQHNNPLKPGEKVPDIQLRVLNSSQPTVHLSQYRGKLLILDFWSTWCSACLGEFPKLEALQNEFKDRLMILPIGFEHAPGDIRKFISKNKSFSLPSAIQTRDDSSIMKLFPFDGLPHEVWIGKDGKLIGFSDQFSLTSENIKKVLDKGKIFLPDEQVDLIFNLSQPLLANNNGGKPTDFLYRSMITRYNPLLRQVHYNKSDSVCTKITIINETALNLIKIAFGNPYADSSLSATFGHDPMDKRNILEGNRIIDKFKHWYTFKNLTDSQQYDFKNNDLYCYEIILPPSFSLREAYKKMLSDLKYFFNVDVYLEKRELNCLVLIPLNNKSSKDEVPKINNTDISPEAIMSHGNPKQIVLYLNNNLKEIPFVINGMNSEYGMKDNFTGYDGRELQKLQVELSKRGLKLIPVKKVMEMLVIKDKEQ